MAIPVSEALRYLGAAGAGEDLRCLAENVAGELERKVHPRFVWKSFRIRREAGEAVLPEAGIRLPGRLAENVLAECDTAVLLACTLGAVFDALLLATEARDMARASVLDACGSAWTEAVCDEAEQEIARRFPALYRTDRFSPGYGDLPLSLQPDIISVLNAGKTLGITVNASFLLTPAKSVTAILGLSEKPQGARIRGCAFCALQGSCAYRERGTFCGE